MPATSDFPLQNLPFGVFSRKTADPCKLRVWGDKDKAHKKSKNKKGKSKKAAGAFGEDCPKSVGVRIGDFVLDLRRLAAVGFFGAADSPLADALSRDTLNTFMGLSSASWSEVRARVTELLSKDNESLQGSPVSGIIVGAGVYLTDWCVWLEIPQASAGSRGGGDYAFAGRHRRLH